MSNVETCTFRFRGPVWSLSRSLFLCQARSYEYPFLMSVLVFMHKQKLLGKENELEKHAEYRLKSGIWAGVGHGRDFALEKANIQYTVRRIRIRPHKL